MRAYTVAAPNPDAAISSQADRQQIAWSYSGILSSGVAADTYWTITFETSRQKLTGGLAVTCATGGLAVTTATGGLSWTLATLPTLPTGTGFLITSAGEYLVNSDGDYLIVNL
jgi:hypothetical protein